MDARRSLLSTQEAGVALGYSSRYFFVRECVWLSKLISSSISSPNNLTLSTCSSRVPFNSILSCFSLVVSFDFKVPRYTYSLLIILKLYRRQIDLLEYFKYRGWSSKKITNKRGPKIEPLCTPDVMLLVDG